MHPVSARARALVLLACLLALAVPAARGANLQPAWSKDFAVPIRWQRVTSIGQLLVDTRDGLYAVDPEAGAVRWSLPGLGTLSEEGFEELAGTPLALINADTDASKRVVIVNTLNGALVFDSRAEQLTSVASTHVLPQSGTLLIAGFEDGKPQPKLFLYGIENGKRLWASDAMTPTVGGKGANALLNLLMSAAIVATGVSPVQSAPLELGDGTFLLGAMGNVYRFDIATGKTLWKTSFAGGRFEFRRAEARPDVVYAGAEDKQTMQSADQQARQSATTLYQAFRIADGAPVWKRPVKFNNPMNRLIIPVDRGLIVSEGDANKGRLQLLAYDTGEGLWGSKGRGIEIAGLVLDYAFAGSNLVLTTGYDSIWKNNETEYLLYVLDPSAAGAFRFAKPFKVKGRMLRTQLADYGLAYVTTHEINVFDPTTGTLKNAPVLRGKEPLATAQDDHFVYAFNPSDGLVYRFDRSTGAIAQFSKVRFELPDRDTTRALDVVDGRVVLLGFQTVAGFDENGALAFNVHYRAPRDPAWQRSLAWAEAVRAGMASAYMGLYSAAAANVAADAERGSATNQVAAEFSRGFGQLQQGYQGLASGYANVARRRYEASAASRDFAFMMIERDDRSVALTQVSKRDGRILAAIDLNRDKTPDYEVDDVSSLVFYRPADTILRAYKFAPERIRVASP
jgi:outer membrane protein assembly factor BamB